MSYIKKILKYLLILLAIILITECAPARRNPYYAKRIKASRQQTNQLGRNRYYFSNSYKKKLAKSYKHNSKSRRK